MMKKITYLLTFLAMTGMVATFTSCNKDNIIDLDAPQITAPFSTEVEVEKSTNLTFSFIAEAGFASSSVTATGGTATVNTNGTTDDTSGDIVVAFRAGNRAGAASVTLTVTDREGDSKEAVAVLTIKDEITTYNISANITSDTTWDSGKTYILQDRIAVVDGVTLTIEPGVVVKGEAGTGTNATALLIARGGKLMAQGTAENPIIFTSVADEIVPGQIASPNLDPDIDGLWGGLIVLGRAPISVSTNEESFQIEGIPASDTNGLYGGSDPTDNSGVIRYISIRHGGANIGEGNEINGLTLGGVGSGTTIEFVEVVANQDDGMEWFGGTVDVSNVLVWNAGDDAIDTDQAWAGSLTNFVVIAGADTDHAMEIDGPEGDMMDAHTVQNGTIKGFETAELADFRSNARGTFKNIYFFNFPDPVVSDGRGDFSLSDNTPDNFANGDLVFDALEVTLPEGVALSDVFKSGTDSHASNVALGANTVGADISQFSWTWASENNQLADF